MNRFEKKLSVIEDNIESRITNKLIVRKLLISEFNIKRHIHDPLEKLELRLSIKQSNIYPGIREPKNI